MDATIDREKKDRVREKDVKSRVVSVVVVVVVECENEKKRGGGLLLACEAPKTPIKGAQTYPFVYSLRLFYFHSVSFGIFSLFVAARFFV